jgi:hypothetical protein
MPFRHRCCPECGTRVEWTRLWLHPWIFARWPCRNCGAPLRFNFARRLLVVLIACLGALLTYVAGEYAREKGVPTVIVFFSAILLIGIPAMLFDGVLLDSEDAEEDENPPPDER